MSKKTTKPTVNTKCVADQYSGPHEKIVEVSFPDGSGALISLWDSESGPRIDVYNVDENITVVNSEKK